MTYDIGDMFCCDLAILSVFNLISSVIRSIIITAGPRRSWAGSYWFFNGGKVMRDKANNYQPLQVVSTDVPLEKLEEMESSNGELFQFIWRKCLSTGCETDPDGWVLARIIQIGKYSKIIWVRQDVSRGWGQSQTFQRSQTCKCK